MYICEVCIIHSHLFNIIMFIMSSTKGNFFCVETNKKSYGFFNFENKDKDFCT